MSCDEIRLVVFIFKLFDNLSLCRPYVFLFREVNSLFQYFALQIYLSFKIALKFVIFACDISFFLIEQYFA